MTYLEKAKDIYNLIGQGKLMDAFEKYYAENVVMQELGEEPRLGKEANRKYELDFLESVKEFHASGVISMASNEEQKVVFIENWLDISFKYNIRMKIEQVCVQNWEGDQIVKEVFYHK
jgi:putative lipase involved disintegration of autophagic bodies